MNSNGTGGWLRFALVLCTAAAIACQDETTTTEISPDEAPPTELRNVERPMLSTMVSSPPLLKVCGTPVQMRLTNFRDTPGTVTVSNDADNLYVTYQATSAEWFISNTRVAVARTVASIPRHGKFPNPWVFPYAGEHNPPQKTITHTISLRSAGLTAGENIVVAAFAGAVHPRTSDWNGPWEWTTLWGIGTVYPVLKKYGLVGNIAINPQPIDDGWDGYMTLEMVRQLNAEGWSVVSHSVNHADLTRLSLAQLTDELTRSKSWIQQKGLRTGNIFVVPYHAWGTRELNEIKKYYAAARGYSINQFWPERFESWPPRDPYALAGYEPEFAPFTTAEGRETTMEYVERAVRDREYLDLFFHRITGDQVAAFESLISQIAAYRANVKTFSQLF